jgi:hypothetical protein
MPNNKDKVLEVLMESARVQVAAMNAGIEFWKKWIEQASEFSSEVNSELLKVTSKSERSSVVGNISDSSKKFIRQVSSLPKLYSDNFESELIKSSRISKKQKSKRRAKAKN